MSAFVVPKVPQDLTLAPVAVSIDRNLALLRDQRTATGVLAALELELDTPERVGDPEERAARVLSVALRNVDLHGWVAEITPDNARLRISGGSVSLDLGLGASVMQCIAGAPFQDHGP